MQFSDDSYGDEELAARFDSGDPTAFEALCTRHRDLVYWCVSRIVQNGPDAEDCTQETFLRFWKFWDRWRDRSRGAAGWLTTIARNVAKTRLRRGIGLPIRQENEEDLRNQDPSAAVDEHRWNRVLPYDTVQNGAVHTGADDKAAVDQSYWKLIPSSSPEEEVLAKEMRQLVQSAVEMLSAPDRHMIDLKYRQEMSLGEIASVLRISLEAAKKRHQRCLKELSQHLIRLARNRE